MPPSASMLEECRQSLLPVLMSAAKARDPSRGLDAKQYLQSLSDDRCTEFLRQAKEMRRQFSSISQKAPMYQEWNASQNHGRGDEKDNWNQAGTRSRLNSMNTVVSDAGVSRRDSEITLVDFPGGKLPPKAPRAMLQAYAKSDPWNDDNDCRPNSNALVASPTVEETPSSVPLVEMDTSEEQPTGNRSTVQLPFLVPATIPRQEDFVSNLPTQPGVWFFQQGKQNAKIVDIDIDVGEDMFFMSRESRLFRMKMDVRLCSVTGPGMVNGAVKEDIDAVIHSDALHWPRKGTLVVQVNPDSDQGKTWLPYTLETSPLDVTSSMVPGKNTFRFIQLSDLSDFAFVLITSPPPPEEAWRSWDWSSAFDRSRMEPRLGDDFSSILSEFAHIPVTIRS